MANINKFSQPYAKRKGRTLLFLANFLEESVRQGREDIQKKKKKAGIDRARGREEHTVLVTSV